MAGSRKVPTTMYMASSQNRLHVCMHHEYWVVLQEGCTCSHEVWVIQTSCVAVMQMRQLLLHDLSSQ